jgi:hypothetical protein
MLTFAGVGMFRANSNHDELIEVVVGEEKRKRQSPERKREDKGNDDVNLNVGQPYDRPCLFWLRWEKSLQLGVERVGN